MGSAAGAIIGLLIFLILMIIFLFVICMIEIKVLGDEIRRSRVNIINEIEHSRKDIINDIGREHEGSLTVQITRVSKKLDEIKKR